VNLLNLIGRLAAVNSGETTAADIGRYRARIGGLSGRELPEVHEVHRPGVTA
jgi:hypothetical protein